MKPKRNTLESGETVEDFLRSNFDFKHEFLGGIAAAVVAVERNVFYMERSAGMYSPFTYAFAKVLIELPCVFYQALAYALIVYAMIGFECTTAKFFWYLFFMYFTLLYYTFYGMMTVAVTPDEEVASIVVTGIFSASNIFSGFIVPRTICPSAYTLYGLVSS